LVDAVPLEQLGVIDASLLQVVVDDRDRPDRDREQDQP
jgi:hypothetical protein